MSFSRRLLNVLRQEVVPSTERGEANCSVQSASESTINGHGDAGHHGGAAAKHEEDNIHDLLLLCEATEGNFLQHWLAQLGVAPVSPPELGENHGRVHRVHSNIVLPQ